MISVITRKRKCRRFKDKIMDFETVIGLEVHAQLKTDSKIFCSCPTEFGKGENTNICPVCTGQPGVLPVLNEKAVEFIAKTGLALNCRVNTAPYSRESSIFIPTCQKTT